MARKSRAQIKYERTRKAIQQRKSYYKQRGFDVDIDLPLTPKQVGFGSKMTPRQFDIFTAELEDWTTTFLSYISQQKRNRGEETVSFDKVILSNFETNLNTRKYGKGANIVKDWYKTIKGSVTNQQLVEALEEGEREGIVVDRVVKYGKEENAVEYTADITKILHRKGYINNDDAIKVLESISIEDEDGQEVLMDAMGEYL